MLEKIQRHDCKSIGLIWRGITYKSNNGKKERFCLRICLNKEISLWVYRAKPIATPILLFVCKMWVIREKNRKYCCVTRAVSQNYVLDLAYFTQQAEIYILSHIIIDQLMLYIEKRFNYLLLLTNRKIHKNTNVHKKF